MFYDVVSVKYLEDYKLKVVFQDGEKGVIDLRAIEQTGVFGRFNDKDYFKRVYIHESVLTWPPGDIDIAPETVYIMATGKMIENFHNEAKTLDHKH